MIPKITVHKLLYENASKWLVCAKKAMWIAYWFFWCVSSISDWQIFQLVETMVSTLATQCIMHLAIMFHLPPLSSHMVCQLLWSNLLFCWGQSCPTQSVYKMQKTQCSNQNPLPTNNATLGDCTSVQKVTVTASPLQHHLALVPAHPKWT